jgi:hypothetical protein
MVHSWTPSLHTTIKETSDEDDAQWINAEQRATQHHDELDGEQAALNAQLIELHRCKDTLRMEHAATIDFTKARALARAVATPINHKGTPCPTFARDSQNVVVATALSDTLPAPSTDGVDKVYH